MRPLFEILGRTPAWEGALVRHGIAAWVADELAEAGRVVPGELQQAARSQLASGLKIKRLTLAVLDSLQGAGVVPVLLKGFGLASRLFPAHPLARPASDVDILVPPAQLPPVELALGSLGLSLGAVPGVEDVFEEHHHRPWVGPAGLVEVHFRLFSGFGGQVFDDAQLRARTQEGRLEGRPVRWLGREDEFIYLAVHAANHSFLRLSWLVDLRRFVEVYPDLDWGAVRERTAAAGFVIPVTTTLELLERLLEVQLPPAARTAFPRLLLRGRLDAQLFSAARVADARWSNGRLASFLLRLYLVDSPRHGARHLLDGARRYLRQRRDS